MDELNDKQTQSYSEMRDTFTNDCHERFGNICNLASTIANQSRTISPEICRACFRTKFPADANEVVLAVAGIKESASGPGTTLKKLISWFIEKPADCNCPNRVKVMDAWGAEGCLKNMPTILDWLRDSAHRNGIRYSEFVIATVVKTICRSHQVVNWFYPPQEMGTDQTD